MPKGPQGQKRPADVIGGAIKVARIATGEEEDIITPNNRRKSGKAGAEARNRALSAKKRTEIAQKASNARWAGNRRLDMSATQCETLKGRFANMASDEGLVDVKFYVRNVQEAVTEQLCQEVQGLYAALEDGGSEPLVFNDSYRGA
jgi:hypothetical protein